VIERGLMLAQIKEQFGVLHSQSLAGESIHAHVIVICAKGIISASNETATSTSVTGNCWLVMPIVLRQERSGLRSNLPLNSVPTVSTREFSFRWQFNPLSMSRKTGSGLLGCQKELGAGGDSIDPFPADFSHYHLRLSDLVDIAFFTRSPITSPLFLLRLDCPRIPAHRYTART
jgi:hypothetical protein